MNCPVWRARDKTGLQVLKKINVVPYHHVTVVESTEDLLLEFDDEGSLEEQPKDKEEAKMESKTLSPSHLFAHSFSCVQEA